MKKKILNKVIEGYIDREAVANEVIDELSAEVERLRHVDDVNQELRAEIEDLTERKAELFKANKILVGLDRENDKLKEQRKAELFKANKILVGLDRENDKLKEQRKAISLEMGYTRTVVHAAQMLWIRKAVAMTGGKILNKAEREDEL